MYKNNTGLPALSLEQGHNISNCSQGKGVILRCFKGVMYHTCISTVAEYSCVMIKKGFHSPHKVNHYGMCSCSLMPRKTWLR